ncbi:DUF1917 domain-containing protein [Halomicrobium sp. IBSBa]|uniref:putative phosphothreonine lyase domain-containing protein n=1 Tax=Halomicrobium sp. IBSBa TaxID=2778916 RepID=UPI001ABF5B05|nr:putative phosphothreonine lyase domain-containg protein [Halomicrobium sp. IBSBa]MBO4247789.1 DUF1917 domain-containing protein [Halomicrobium sp. IBSBa]
MQSPLEITDEEQYWLRSRDVSDSPTVAGDAYFSEYSIACADETTVEALPPADSDTVREIDREALDQELLTGKWQITGSPERVEDLFPKLVADAEDGIVWAVKAMTTFGFENLSMYDEYLLTVYTPNYFDREDVRRIRDHLRREYGEDGELYYKPDIYTKKGIDATTAAEFGLSAPARYVE